MLGLDILVLNKIVSYLFKKFARDIKVKAILSNRSISPSYDQNS